MTATLLGLKIASSGCGPNGLADDFWSVVMCFSLVARHNAIARKKMLHALFDFFRRPKMP
jgi:hypothetical protein